MTETPLHFLRRALAAGIPTPAALAPEDCDDGSLAGILPCVARCGDWGFHGHDEVGAYHLVYWGERSRWADFVAAAREELWAGLDTSHRQAFQAKTAVSHGAGGTVVHAGAITPHEACRILHVAREAEALGLGPVRLEGPGLAP